MNKCVNIEVLLKAAEYIEQANIGIIIIIIININKNKKKQISKYIICI